VQSKPIKSAKPVKGEELKQQRFELLMGLPDISFINFKGATMVRATKTDRWESTGGFIRLEDDFFARIVYKTVSLGMSANNIRDLQHAVSSNAPDWSPFARYVAFRDGVWDRETLTFVEHQMEFVYSTDIAINEDTSLAEEFLLQLSKGDKDLAHDYVQGMAGLFMGERPTGIIWFVGDGANGKSALLKALYLGFGTFFSSMTTADLEDGRDIPSMRGIMGNVVLEGSEARVVDSKVYKSIGSHEQLHSHLFNKQSGITVDSNFHTIFNANNIPVFADKTGAIKRRTWTIPFPAHFADDPTFEKRTFTPEFLGGLFKLILDAAVEIRDNGNKYTWSAATQEMKRQYSDSVNSAEAFVDHLKSLSILGVYNYSYLTRNYMDWCSREGHIPLSIQTLKRVLTNSVGATSRVTRDGERTSRRLIFDDALDMPSLTWEEGSGYGVETPSEPKVVDQTKLDSSW
jgi:phage/plasmid-associated DNA primase